MSEMTVDSLPMQEESSGLQPVWNLKGGLITLGLFIVGFLIATAIQAVMLFNANGGLEGYQMAQESGTMVFPFELSIATFLTNTIAGMLSVWVGLKAMGKDYGDIGLGALDWKWIGIGIAVAFPLLVIRLALAGGLMMLNPELQEQMEALSQMVGNGSTPLTIIISLLLVSFAVPVGEEVFFRGFIYRWSRNRMSLWPAAILSALVFSIYHLNLIQGVSVFFLGLGCAWVYEKSKSLWPAIAMHMVGNLIGQGIGYLALLFPDLMQ